MVRHVVGVRGSVGDLARVDRAVEIEADRTETFQDVFVLGRRVDVVRKGNRGEEKRAQGGLGDLFPLARPQILVQKAPDRGTIDTG